MRPACFLIVFALLLAACQPALESVSTPMPEPPTSTPAPTETPQTSQPDLPTLTAALQSQLDEICQADPLLCQTYEAYKNSRQTDPLHSLALGLLEISPSNDPGGPPFTLTIDPVNGEPVVYLDSAEGTAVALLRLAIGGDEGHLFIATSPYGENARISHEGPGLANAYDEDGQLLGCVSANTGQWVNASQITAEDRKQVIVGVSVEELVQQYLRKVIGYPAFNTIKEQEEFCILINAELSKTYSEKLVFTFSDSDNKIGYIGLTKDGWKRVDGLNSTELVKAEATRFAGYEDENYWYYQDPDSQQFVRVKKQETSEEDVKNMLAKDGLEQNIEKMTESDMINHVGNVIIYRTADKVREVFPIVLESRSSGEQRISNLFHIEVLKPDRDENHNITGFIKTKVVIMPTVLFAPDKNGKTVLQRPGQPEKTGTIQPFFGDGNTNLQNAIVWLISLKDPKISIEQSGFFAVQIPTFNENDHALAIFIIQEH